jgi:serine/threonine-protein kinase
VLVENGEYERAIAVDEELVRLRTAARSSPAELAGSITQLASVQFYAANLGTSDSLNERALELYRGLHGDRHPQVAELLINHRGAEPLFRDAVRSFTATQGATHLNTGIARIKLGRALLRQGRFAEAERETRAGYEIVKAQAEPAVSFLVAARTDLALALDSLGRKAAASAQ